MNTLYFLEHMYGGEPFYRMPMGGYRVICPCCKKPFTMTDSFVMTLQRCTQSEIRETLMTDGGAICVTCQDDYGSYRGFLRADEITEKGRALDERDGISPMAGAE